ncbi:MAG: hypothetical protein ABSC37_08095 [Xanthobacteraceae bacterium]
MAIINGCSGGRCRIAAAAGFRFFNPLDHAAPDRSNQPRKRR